MCRTAAMLHHTPAMPTLLSSSKGSPTTPSTPANLRAQAHQQCSRRYRKYSMTYTK
jgi:hypothetical protein